VIARFRIVGCLDLARPSEGTVAIDRKLSLFSVRPLGRRRQYVLPLSKVAEIVVAKIIKTEVAERKTAKRRRS